MIDISTITPTLDQIRISILHGSDNPFNKALSTFESVLGKRHKIRYKNQREGYEFRKKGIILTVPNDDGYSSLHFSYDPITNHYIQQVLLLLPDQSKVAKYWYKSKSLTSMEIAFDLFFGEKDYPENEKILTSIGYSCLTKKPSCTYVYPYHGDFEYCSDNAINGMLTYYWNSITKKSASEGYNFIRSKNSTYSNKAYCKKLDNLWCVRLETLFKKSAINKIIPVFPNEMCEIQKAISDYRLTDFWMPVEVDYSRFIDDLHQIRNIRDKELLTMLNVSLNNPVATQLCVMRKAAKVLNADRLRANINKYVTKKQFKDILPE